MEQIECKQEEKPSIPKPSVLNASPDISTGNNKTSIGSWLLEDDDNIIIS